TGTLASAVVEHHADLGLALDGDADRLLAIGPDGAMANGDELIALFALDLAERGQLAGNTVVVTVMTNLGFRMAMQDRGIIVKETPVGDRYVLAALDKDGLALGGEQSGHIIFRRLATTGDGLLTGLVLADLVVRSGAPLAVLLDGLVARVPQVLVNVPVPNTGLLEGAEAVWSAVAEEEERLGETGRVLLRPSGTEPLVRVMVEAGGDGVAEAIAQRLGALVRYELRAAATTNG
ncbi:MAG: phosphoglucosamine mutase, partial [Acidimicrobiales bacterium]